MNDDAMRMRIVVMALVGEELARFCVEATLHTLSVEPGDQQPHLVPPMVECRGSRFNQDGLAILQTFRPPELDCRPFQGEHEVITTC